MTIREAKISDLDSLSLLFDSYRIFYRKSSDIEAARTFLRARLSLSDSVIYIAEDMDAHLSGFVQLYPLYSSTRMKRLWLLNDLYVAKEDRGRGISVLLIDRAKKLVQDTAACGMFLETEISNSIGQKLYAKTGFVQNKGSLYYEWYV